MSINKHGTYETEDFKDTTNSAPRGAPFKIHYQIIEYHVEFLVTHYSPSDDNGPIEKDYDYFLEGSIKWDGCSNWDMSPNECAMHFCGPDDIDTLARILKRLYTIAEEKLPTYRR